MNRIFCFFTYDSLRLKISGCIRPSIWGRGNEPVRRVATVWVTLMMVVGFSGCSVVRDEAYYPGGATGRLLDSVMIADSQKSRTARMALGLVVTSAMVAESATTETEALAAQIFIDRAYLQIASAQQAAAGDCPRMTGNFAFADEVCDAPQPTALAFEGLSMDAERQLINLTKLALSSSELKEAFNELDRLTPLAVIRVLGKIGDVVPMLQRAFASYRDSIVLLSHAAVRSSSCRMANSGFQDVCHALEHLLEGRVIVAADAMMPQVKKGRTIGGMARLLKDVYEDPNFMWSLETGHVAAIVYQIDRTCEVLHQRTESSAQSSVACVEGSKGRTAFLEAFKVSVQGG